MRGLLLALLCLAGTACHPTPRFTAWRTAPSLIIARSSGCAAAVGSTLYVLGGGWTDATTALTSVEFATIGPAGRPDAWHLTARMTTPRVFPACVALSGYLYAIGGERFSAATPILLNSVERAPILPDGNLGLWETTARMTTPRRAPTAIAADHAIYVTGGYNGRFLSTTERARLQPDGTLGPWEILAVNTTMPRYIHAAARDGQTIYLLGGHDESTGMATNRTEWARILPSGNLSSWVVGPTLRSPRFLAAAAIVNRQLFLFGGSTGRHSVEQAETAAIRTDGTLSPFTPLTASPAARSGAAVATDSRTLYLIGGLRNHQATGIVDYAAAVR